MRRALVLALLYFGMQLIRPLGHEVPSSEALLTFGFLILAAYTVGEVVAGIGLPKLVGYLLAGIIFGPSALQVVSADVIIRLSPVNRLAVALIAFMAGAELQWSEVKERGLGYFKILSSEMGLTFVIIVASIFVLQPMIPVLDGRGIEHVTVFALLVAAIAVAHSPAATLGLLTETRARGPVARTSLGVVLMSDVVLIILFTLVATIARTVVPPPGATHLPSLGMVVWEIAGALVVGGAIGAAVALYLRFTHRELLLFGIIVAMLGAEVARLAHVELLLTILVAGFIAENFAPHGRGAAMRDAVERAANPVFVVFFALSGASIALADVASMILIVAPLVLLRIFAIWAGCSFGGKWAKLDMPSRKYIWMGLVAQAGVAIGLATLVAEIYPQLGPAIQTLTLAMIAINQLVGPILFRRALDASGEIQATNSS